MQWLTFVGKIFLSWYTFLAIIAHIDVWYNTQVKPGSVGLKMNNVTFAFMLSNKLRFTFSVPIFVCPCGRYGRFWCFTDRSNHAVNVAGEPFRADPWHQWIGRSNEKSVSNPFKKRVWMISWLYNNRLSPIIEIEHSSINKMEDKVEISRNGFIRGRRSRQDPLVTV